MYVFRRRTSDHVWHLEESHWITGYTVEEPTEKKKKKIDEKGQQMHTHFLFHIFFCYHIVSGGITEKALVYRKYW